MDPLILVVLGMCGVAGVGLYGLLASRNLIKIIVALQILAKSAVLALVAAGSASGKIDLSQSLAITVIVVDTVVAAVGLALGVQVRKQFGSLDVANLSSLKR
ncbi:MAG: NADH-quinone oxidoreductase subunit K [Anaerolineales bacterium]